MTALLHFLASVGAFCILTVGAVFLWFLVDEMREKLDNARRAEAGNRYKAVQR